MRQEYTVTFIEYADKLYHCAQVDGAFVMDFNKKKPATS